MLFVINSNAGQIADATFNARHEAAGCYRLLSLNGLSRE
jgi:hypothetical protein